MWLEPSLLYAIEKCWYSWQWLVSFNRRIAIWGLKEWGAQAILDIAVCSQFLLGHLGLCVSTVCFGGFQGMHLAKGQNLWDAGFPCCPSMVSTGMCWSLSVQVVFSVKSRLIISVESLLKTRVIDLSSSAGSFRKTNWIQAMGTFESLNFSYFSLSWPVPSVPASNLIMLCWPREKDGTPKILQELTILTFLQVLEKQQLSAPLISQRWFFYINGSCMGTVMGGSSNVPVRASS